MNSQSNKINKQIFPNLVLLLIFLLVSCSSFAQAISKFIIVDQFGYLPLSPKIAVLKNPQIGYDSDLSYTPGNTFAVVNVLTKKHVFTGKPIAWNDGKTDETSGDQIWHFDFSSVTNNGTYYVLDVENNLRSFTFNINPTVYNEVLKQAVRTFFYQRLACEKEATYAEIGWADGASHIGPLQDKNCRLFNDKDNVATEKDVSGGWYDAGDYNKYTNWTSNYVLNMMLAYLENPNAWGDDYNIPESGNGIPDLLDEAKWGTDHLLRLQFDDGSLISVVGESHGSPPSAATGQSLYGPSNTSATLSGAAAYALTSTVFRSIGMEVYADSLLTSAERAWEWADANPSVIFKNNNAEYDSKGLASGQQEVDDYGREVRKFQAAAYLFEATGKTKYRDYFDAHYREAHMFAWNFVYPYEATTQDVLLYYTTLSDATVSVCSDIKSVYKNSMLNSKDNFTAYDNMTDPYLAHIGSYTWGSNSTKGKQGGMFYNVFQYELDESKNYEAINASAGFIHYIHGVNPLSKVFLSNMNAFGAENSVNEFYHSWFKNGSELWDRVGKSTYGPPPGYVPGGPNPNYDWDDCCLNSCGSTANNSKCFDEDITPPKNQPAQKSYKDFNNSWPLNSWEVTENSCNYQLSYIRLLSKFVNLNVDCNGDTLGTATLDACGICTGGNTGLNPTSNTCDCYNLASFSVEVVCDEYVSASGKYTWTESGIYTDTIKTAEGCDSIVTIDLQIVNEHAEVTFSNDTFKVNSLESTYQWIDCEDNSIIEGATAQTYSPEKSGSYAVQLIRGNCSFITECYDYVYTGKETLDNANCVNVYPNPFSESFRIVLSENSAQTEIEILNISGVVVFGETMINKAECLITPDIPSGIYVIKINDYKNPINSVLLVKE